MSHGERKGAKAASDMLEFALKAFAVVIWNIVIIPAAHAFWFPQGYRRDTT
jgi:hypothetical protein